MSHLGGLFVLKSFNNTSPRKYKENIPQQYIVNSRDEGSQIPEGLLS